MLPDILPDVLPDMLPEDASEPDMKSLMESLRSPDIEPDVMEDDEPGFMDELEDGREDEELLSSLPQQPANSMAVRTAARMRIAAFFGKIQTPFRLPADAGRRAGRSL